MSVEETITVDGGGFWLSAAAEAAIQAATGKSSVEHVADIANTLVNGVDTNAQAAIGSTSSTG